MRYFAFYTIQTFTCPVLVYFASQLKYHIKPMFQNLILNLYSFYYVREVKLSENGEISCLGGTKLPNNVQLIVHNI